MLQLPTLRKIQQRDAYTYEALHTLLLAFNSLALALGIDPTLSVISPTPANIGSLNVTAAEGIFDIAIVDKSPKQGLIFYFLEYDIDVNFPSPIVVFMGPSRNLRAGWGDQTLYFRAYSQYLGSSVSKPVTFGNPPTAVVGGGSAGTAILPSQGTGAATGQQGGSGFGAPNAQ